MSRQKKLGGSGSRNDDANKFAKANGFTISFTAKNHVMYRGHGGIVVGSSSPRSPDNVKAVIGNLKRVLIQAGIQKDQIKAP